MEITEPMVAEAYKKFNVNIADIESNNGGRAFARNVERITRDKGNYKTVVKWFHQSGNKIARILSNSAWVNNNIYMPIDWKNKWSEFAGNPYPDRSARCGHEGAAERVHIVAVGQVGAHQLGGNVFVDAVAQIGIDDGRGGPTHIFYAVSIIFDFVHSGGVVVVNRPLEAAP